MKGSVLAGGSGILLYPEIRGTFTQYLLICDEPRRISLELGHSDAKAAVRPFVFQSSASLYGLYSSRTKVRQKICERSYGIG